MLQFKRKQMAAIGATQLQHNIIEFLRRQLPEETAALPEDELEAGTAALIEHCRKHGLTSQRAVAAYVLAAFVCGSQAVLGDPVLGRMLADRRTPQDERGRLIEIWLADAWGHHQRATAEVH